MSSPTSSTTEVTTKKGTPSKVSTVPTVTPTQGESIQSRGPSVSKESIQAPAANSTSRTQPSIPLGAPSKSGDAKQNDDETSTVASTLTGGPVSYVEFKETPIEQQLPDNSRLSESAKLLTVDIWGSDATLVRVALDKLGLMCKSESGIKEMHSQGGHMGLTVVLRKWPMSAPVQAAALNCLHKAAESLEFCQAVGRLGAIDLVLVALKNHPRNEAVATAGCGALLNLTLPADNAREMVFHLKGIPTVCATCAQFSQTIMIQKYVLWLVQYMSYWEDFKKPIVQDGGLHALAEIIERFSDGSQDALVKSARATMQRLL